MSKAPMQHTIMIKTPLFNETAVFLYAGLNVVFDPNA